MGGSIRLHQSVRSRLPTRDPDRRAPDRHPGGPTPSVCHEPFVRPALAGVLFAGIGIAAGLSGCQKAPPALAKTKDPEVIVARPTNQEVTDHEDFTGHIEAEN